ncbi:HAD family hydrolase [Chloroflexota bacterium]
MIKAVFFDLYQTLVGYEPPREEIQAKAMREFGVEIEPEALRRPIVMADEYIYGEMSISPLSQRSDDDKQTLWMTYQKVLVEAAGIEPSNKLLKGLLGRMMQAKMELVTFDDVVPALTELQGRGLILGLISNIEKDILPTLEELGLARLLPVVVTSLDTGFSKPQPEIFREALKKAGVDAAAAIYVGDQYRVDMVGAAAAGMKGVLLDRGGYLDDMEDCPRISSLAQVTEHL